MAQYVQSAVEQRQEIYSRPSSIRRGKTTSMTATPECNLCGARQFVDIKARRNARCGKCGSLERTRLSRLVLDSLDCLKRGARVLYLAPERGLYAYMRSRVGDSITVADFDVDRYRKKYPDIKYLDLCGDFSTVSKSAFDLVVHSHVLEHVPCNYVVALKQLNDLLKPNGYHVCSIPVSGGHFDEYLGPLSVEEAVRRFGQFNHVRRFGREDLRKTLGKVIPLPARYELQGRFAEATLRQFNIPEYCWSGYTPHSVLFWRKEEFLI